MNTVISGSVLDEALAAALLRHRDSVLAPRRHLLAARLAELAAWCETEQARIEWVRPQAGALCCLRLRADRFDVAAVARIWDLLPAHQLQLAFGTWFGESDRVFRLGFGYLPPGQLGAALAALTHVMDAATFLLYGRFTAPPLGSLYVLAKCSNDHRCDGSGPGLHARLTWPRALHHPPRHHSMPPTFGQSHVEANRRD